jgi:hypothetical protein
MMHKLLTFKNLVIAAIMLLVLAQGASWYMLNNANQKIQDTQSANQLTLNEIDRTTQQEALVPIPGTNRLYLAELNFTIPVNPTTSSIRYNFNVGTPGEDNGEARLTSTFMTDHSVHIKSCSDMVRLKMESKPNTYSPDQPLYATVTLADGRALQVYASTTKECQLAWQAVSPQNIAEAFKAASAY